MPEPEPEAGAEDPYLDALARYRETARWVLTALGAAAVATIAGFGLADFGKLNPAEEPARFAVASLGVVLAIAGFLGCVRQALRLASESWTEPRDLFPGRTKKGNTPLDEARRTVNEPANGALAGFDDLELLSEAHLKALGIWKREQALYTRDADDSARQLAGRWMDQVMVLGTAVQRATLLGSTRLLRAKFDAASKRLLVWGAVAAAGIVAFAWAVTAPSPTIEVIGPLPDRGELAVADGARASLGDTLGEGCNLDAVEVVVTATDDKGVPTVVVTDDDCTPISLEVEPAIGTVTPE